MKGILMRHDVIRPIILFLVALSAPAQASTAAEQRLQPKLDALLKLPDHQGEIVRSATLLATSEQLAALCDAPVLSLAGKDSRLAGRRTLVARCGARKHFLAIRIHAQGRWWAARTSLPAGHVLQAGDIVAQRGDLAGQPAGLIFQQRDILGQRLIRDVEAGKPLLSQQLRQPRLLRAGQTVEVITLGEGFRVRSQGKALHHAAENDTLRVQMRNGQTLSGLVSAGGLVVISLTQ
ncbi:flagellar basal body P-ring biosynthesis protein FlgA [Enterobacter cancerogenus]|nr:flagellar basal body P-ring biosynthesis protein FlgA [Enterobacter cancerogenus]